MRNQEYRRYICCTLAVIMIFLGMCLEMTETDSFFAYDASSLTSAHLQSVEPVAGDDSSCTNEMLGRQQTIQPRVIAATNAGRMVYRTILLSFIVGGILQYLFYLRGVAYCEQRQIACSRAITIGYIHHTDGEK